MVAAEGVAAVSWVSSGGEGGAPTAGTRQHAASPVPARLHSCARPRLPATPTKACVLLHSTGRLLPRPAHNPRLLNARGTWKNVVFRGHGGGRAGWREKVVAAHGRRVLLFVGG